MPDKPNTTFFSIFSATDFSARTSISLTIYYQLIYYYLNVNTSQKISKLMGNTLVWEDIDIDFWKMNAISCYRS